MNDRFKFRVWNKNTHSFTTGGAIKFGGLCFVDEEDFGIKLGEHQEDYIIEQCTGLKDKNGNLIYEGDVVKIGNGSINGEVIESDLVVEWICKNGRYNLPTWTSDVPDWSHYVEIIGNIHEQAEQKD